MAALEASVAAAKESRKRHPTAGPGEKTKKRSTKKAAPKKAVAKKAKKAAASKKAPAKKAS